MLLDEDDEDACDGSSVSAGFAILGRFMRVTAGEADTMGSGGCTMGDGGATTLSGPVSSFSS